MVHCKHLCPVWRRFEAQPFPFSVGQSSSLCNRTCSTSSFNDSGSNCVIIQNSGMFQHHASDWMKIIYHCRCLRGDLKVHFLRRGVWSSLSYPPLWLKFQNWVPLEEALERDAVCTWYSPCSHMYAVCRWCAATKSISSTALFRFFFIWTI